MSSSSPSNCSFPASRVVYADLVLSPRCPALNERLIHSILTAMQSLGESSVRFSLAVVGAALPTVRTPDSFFTSAVHAACIQQILPERDSGNVSSVLISFLSCSFASETDSDDSQTAICAKALDASTRQALTTCAANPDVMSMARSFARSVSGDVFPQFPFLFLDGNRYCASWDSDSISKALCDTAQLPPAITTGQGSALWPAPRVTVNFNEACPVGSYGRSNAKPSCLVVGEKGGMFVEMVPVIGLVFLAASTLSLGLMILYRRQMNRRLRQQQGRRMAEFDNERLQAIMQFIAHFASSADSVVDLARHHEEVRRQLALLPVRTCSEGESCTICLDPIDRFYELRCGHMFHTECLRTWFERGKSDCPVCRTKIIGTISAFSSTTQAAQEPVATGPQVEPEPTTEPPSNALRIT